jgi:hypothetical protein
MVEHLLTFLKKYRKGLVCVVIAVPLLGYASVCIGGDDIQSEVKATILRQEKENEDESLAALKDKLQQDLSQCRSFSIKQCNYATTTMFGQPLNNPGWSYYAPQSPDARPYDSESSCAEAAVRHCDPDYRIVGNDEDAVQLLKDRTAIADFRYTADDWVLDVKSINNFEGTIVAHVTFRKKHTESEIRSYKYSMERRNGALLISTAPEEE